MRNLKNEQVTARWAATPVGNGLAAAGGRLYVGRKDGVVHGFTCAAE